MSQHFSLADCGKAPEGQPRSEPDSGNPTVRDRRGARGNVEATRAPTQVLEGHWEIFSPSVCCAPRLYPDPDDEGIETLPSSLRGCSH